MVNSVPHARALWVPSWRVTENLAVISEVGFQRNDEDYVPKSPNLRFKAERRWGLGDRRIGGWCISVVDISNLSQKEREKLQKNQNKVNAVIDRSIAKEKQYIKERPLLEKHAKVYLERLSLQKKQSSSEEEITPVFAQSKGGIELSKVSPDIALENLSTLLEGGGLAPDSDGNFVPLDESQQFVVEQTLLGNSRIRLESKNETGGKDWKDMGLTERISDIFGRMFTWRVEKTTVGDASQEDRQKEVNKVARMSLEKEDKFLRKNSEVRKHVNLYVHLEKPELYDDNEATVKAATETDSSPKTGWLANLLRIVRSFIKK